MERTPREGRPFRPSDPNEARTRRVETSRERRAQPERTLPTGMDPIWHLDVGERRFNSNVPTHRLFVSIQLPEPAIEEIASFINDMPAMAGTNVRWTPRVNVHLTLLFLGDTPTELIPRIQEQLQQAAANTSPFMLKLGETGAFPSLHAPRILWVGLQGEVHRLMQLQGRIEGALRSLGFAPEKRPFTPHITVGRAVRDLDMQYAGDVGFSWRRSMVPAVRAEVPVNEVQLLRSKLQTGGAQYMKVFGAQLGGEEAITRRLS